jgi:hypothetical protein
MYLQTLSTSPFDTEKADAVSCHENFPMHNLFWLIKFSELSAIIVAKSSSDNFGEREARKWTWSGLAYI